MINRDRRLHRPFKRQSQCSSRRGKNLADHLIKARLSAKPTVQTRAATGARVVGVRRCSGGGRRQSCPLCPHLGASPRDVMQEVKIHHSGEIIKIRENMSCTDQGCLYLLSCKKGGCRKQYIGESGRPVYKRFKDHQDSSEDPGTSCPVGLHFQLPGHSKKDMEMVPLEKVRGNTAVRKIRERNLINKFQMITHGLNVRL